MGGAELFCFYWEESTINIWRADLSLDDYCRGHSFGQEPGQILLWSPWSIGQALYESGTNWSLFFRKTNRNTRSKSSNSMMFPLCICLLSFPERSFSNAISNSSHLYGEWLLSHGVWKELRGERGGGTRRVCAKTNCNLETAAISKNLQFEFYHPFRGLLAVKWSCTSSFPPGVRMLL